MRLVFLSLLLVITSCAKPPFRDRPLSGPGSITQSTGQTLPPTQVTEITKKEIPVAPWQFWSSKSYNNEALSKAEAAMSEGLLEIAVSHYREAIDTVGQKGLRDAARLRLAGTLLKLGRAEQALKEISIENAESSGTPEQLDSRFAIVAAYSYLHERNIDQSLAWFAVAGKKTDRSSPVSIRSSEGASKLLASLPQNQIQDLSSRWDSDTFIGPLFKREKLRRASSKGIIPLDYATLFSTNRYSGLEANGVLPSGFSSTDVVTQRGDEQKIIFSNTGQATIGILLPLSGKYAAHARKVRQGIELAASQSVDAAKIQIRIADTAGNPDRAIAEYERLVGDEQVDVVLGPLLVATTEAVSQRSSKLGVPIISFSKREGIPQLGNTVFRLGATSDSQVKDLLRYTSEQLGLTRYAIIHPKTSTGVEFDQIFEKEVPLFGGTIVAAESYKGGVPDTAALAVSKIQNTMPEAIFIPDTLDYALPILKSINNSNVNNAVLLGQAQWSDPVAIRGYGRLLDRAVFVSLFNPSSKSLEVRSFVDSYRQKFSSEPELLAAQSYDAANIAIKSILSGNGALGSSGGYQGVTGFLIVEGDGEISRKMSVMRLRSGAPVEVMSGGKPAVSESLSTP